MTQQAGFFLSIPVYGSVDPIITSLTDATTIEEAREDAIDAGMVAFMQAGYEDSEEVFGTLYAIAPNGGLVHSEMFTVSGPEAN